MFVIHSEDSYAYLYCDGRSIKVSGSDHSQIQYCKSEITSVNLIELCQCKSDVRGETGH